MKPQTIGLSLILGVSLTLVGCNKGDEKAAPAADAPKVEAFPEGTKVTDLFPTTPGTQSTYTLGKNNQLTFRIKDVSDSGENKIVTMDIVEKEKVTDSIQWQVGPKGIFQVTARNGKKYEPAQMAVAPDFTSREEFKYSGKGPFPSAEPKKQDFGQLTGLLRNRGIETVDTEMGQIQALAVESAYSYESDGKKYAVRNTTWFAPKYGIVRVIQGTQREDGANSEMTLKLKGFRSK
jgi:hypothetical protein